ncbi:MAG TPA: hypothetical protein VFH49_13675 [Aquabacterium sp.]|nr:hypothetical protein [Aquabacterium sp.]
MTLSTAQKVIRMVAAAPPAPPCFESRDSWLEYLRAAEAAHKERERPLQGPFIQDQFNLAFNFCEDCNSGYAATKGRLNLCHPDWLIKQLPKVAI